MTSFRYYNSTKFSTMAGSTKETEGISFVLHQELSAQPFQEMCKHQDLEGLPFDGGGIGQDNFAEETNDEGEAGDLHTEMSANEIDPVCQPNRERDRDITILLLW